MFFQHSVDKWVFIKSKLYSNLVKYQPNGIKIEFLNQYVIDKIQYVLN